MMDLWNSERVGQEKDLAPKSSNLGFTSQYSILPIFHHSMVPYGRLAQLDRALVSGTKGRGFNPRIARHSFLYLWVKL